MISLAVRRMKRPTPYEHRPANGAQSDEVAAMTEEGMTIKKLCSDDFRCFTQNDFRSK